MAFSNLQIGALDKTTLVSDTQQYAALCYRFRKGKLRILMISSRRTKRWVIPKGWAMEGLTGAQCAAQEAWEEAGVHGRVGENQIGQFSYLKEAEKKLGQDMICNARVFPLVVKTLKGKFPEKGQRRRKWMSRKAAANAVWEPELAKLIRNFTP